LNIKYEDFLNCFNEVDIQRVIQKSKIKTAQQAIDEIVASQKWKLLRKSAIVSAVSNFAEKPRSSLDFIQSIFTLNKFYSNKSKRI